MLPCSIFDSPILIVLVLDLDLRCCRTGRELEEASYSKLMFDRYSSGQREKDREFEDEDD